MDAQNVAEILMLLSNRLAEVEAAQEELLRSQARFLAALEQKPFDEIYAAMKRRVQGSTETYRKQMLEELARYRRQARKESQN